MTSSTQAWEKILGVIYAGLITLPCLIILLAGVIPWLATVTIFFVYAFALFPTYFLDHALFGGAGFHSPVTFAILALTVAASLWPLPLLAFSPKVRESNAWRRGLLGYGAIFFAGLIFAAFQMHGKLGLFFG